MNKYLDIAPEVAEALAAGKPVVALESTIISHGMPYPQNVETALKVESIMKSAARTQLIMRHVNRMLGIYKVVCENSVDEGEQRHYRVIEALYLRDRPLSPTAVAEREKIDKRTVYKDVDAACATLSALIFGIDGIKKA